MTEQDLKIELRRALAIAQTAIERRLDTPTTSSAMCGAGIAGREGDVQTWEYTTWRVRSIWGQRAEVLVVDGVEFAAEERPPLYESLARAGEVGWELIAFDSAEGAMIFKRRKVEVRRDARQVQGSVSDGMDGSAVGSAAWGVATEYDDPPRR